MEMKDKIINQKDRNVAKVLKWYSCIDNDNKVRVDYCTWRKQQGTIYASSERIIKQALDLIPEEDRYMLFEE